MQTVEKLQKCISFLKVLQLLSNQFSLAFLDVNELSCILNQTDSTGTVLLWLSLKCRQHGKMRGRNTSCQLMPDQIFCTANTEAVKLSFSRETLMVGI